MKNFLKIFGLLSILYCMPIVSMEKDDSQESETQLNYLEPVAGIFNELWELIFCYAYCNTDECADMYEAGSLEYLKKQVILNFKNFCLVCKTFYSINRNIVSKKKLANFYRALFTEKFLELHGDCFYPKNNLTWGFDEDIDKKIGRFLNDKNEDDGIITLVLSSLLGDLDLKEKTVSLLLLYGADINAKHKTFKDCSALHHALVWHGYEGKNWEPIIKLLLVHGINVNVKNGRGYTPIHFALAHDIMQKSTDRIEIIKMFLDKKADINIPGNDGRTVLETAKKYPPKEKILELLQGRSCQKGNQP